MKLDTQTKITLLLVGAAIFLLLLTITLLHNKIISQKNRLETNWSLIDVELKRKADVLENLVVLLKSNIQYEEQLFSSLNQIRASLQISTVPEKIESNRLANQDILLIQEKYPTLSAHASFLKLMDEYRDIEKQIAYQRIFYNETLLMYNRTIESFPSNLVAKALRFHTHDYITFPEVRED